MHDLNEVDTFEVVEACMRNQVIVIFSPPMGEGAARQTLAASSSAAIRRTTSS